jgi:hypothetical protein
MGISLRHRQADSAGFSLLGYVIGIAVCLSVTGVLATVAVAGDKRVEDVVTKAICQHVVAAEVAFHIQNGRFTDNPKDLVAAGLLRVWPTTAHDENITIQINGNAGFAVLVDERVVLSRSL